jgi:glutaredoxin
LVRAPIRPLLVVVSLIGVALPGAPAVASVSSAPATAHVRDGDGQGAITLYGATWCPSCRALEATLHERGIPFDLVDVDREPQRYEMARRASGTNAIPLSNIVRGPQVSWIVGNDPDAVERAYKGS